MLTQMEGLRTLVCIRLVSHRVRSTLSQIGTLNPTGALICNEPYRRRKTAVPLPHILRSYPHRATSLEEVSRPINIPTMRWLDQRNEVVLIPMEETMTRFRGLLTRPALIRMTMTARMHPIMLLESTQKGKRRRWLAEGPLKGKGRAVST